MGAARVWRRIRPRAIAAWRRLLSVLGRKVGSGRFRSYLDAHTKVTFRAFADAVVPETPELRDELGPEHVPGGLEIDLDDFAITYVNDLFQFGLPHIGPRGNLPLATPVANVLDVAALKLLVRRANESEPSSDRPVSLFGPDDPSPTTIKAAAGPFAMLSRRDRLRAISLLDEFEVEVEPFPNLVIEIDGGLVGQLVVGFTEMIYYSEWEGYEEFARPPSERAHPNDPSAVQSWRQTGYPGFANGYAALRGYVGTAEGPLGDGGTWGTIDDDAPSPVLIRRRSGRFRENDYDTSGYEEPYPEVES